MKHCIQRIAVTAAVVLGLATSSFAQATTGAAGAGQTTQGAGPVTPGGGQGAQGGGQAGDQGAQPQGAQPQGAGQGPTGTSTEPTFEVTGGYQWLHADDQTFPFGLNVDGSRNFGPLDLVAEVGWAYDQEDEAGLEASLHAWNFGVGPRWSRRGAGRVWPFAQVLVGGLHARASAEFAGAEVSDSNTWFTLQPGVGVNVIGGDGWGIVGQVDYRHVFVDDEERGTQVPDGDDDDFDDDDDSFADNQFRVFVGLRLVLD